VQTRQLLNKDPSKIVDRRRSPNSTISTTDVTKEQWDMMMKPFDDLLENAPKPFNYEELIEDKW